MLSKIELFLKFKRYKNGLTSREWYRFYLRLRTKVRDKYYGMVRKEGSYAYWWKIDKAKRDAK